jgi:hypothetical protein
MVLRAAVALTGLLAVAPAFAEPMNAETARRFVAGKLFAFTCFEGSTGTGRIFNDGSVAGVMRMKGNGNTRFMHLPAGTLFPKEGRICSNVKGAFFNPCFELNKTSDKSFRGSVSGFGFAYCDFTRRGGRGEPMQASVAPEATGSVTRASIRRGAKPQHEKPAAAPTTPVTSAPLPGVEQAAIRPSIAP